MNCPKCGTDNSKKNGLSSSGYQRHKCKDCDREFTENNSSSTSYPEYENADSTSTMSEDMNYLYVDTNTTDGSIPTIKSLLDKFDVDQDIWKVTNFKVNQWDVSAKEEVDGKIFWNTHTNYQAKASLVRKVPFKCDWPVVKGASLLGINFNVSIPKRELKVDIIIPDSQCGFKRNMQTGEVTSLHDMDAINVVTKVIQDVRPNRIIMLGDMLDLPDWSTHFVHSPEFFFTTQQSIDFLASWISELRPYCEEMVYIEGNHEKRMIDSIIKNTIQAYGIREANKPDTPPVLSVPYILGLEKLGVKYVGDYPHGEFYINDNLVCIHGHKVGAKSGQSVTKMLDSPRVSMITGHVHRLEMAHKTVWTHGKPKFYQALSLGTLAKLNGIVPAASTRHNWQQGFGIVEYDEERFQVDSIGIYDGKAIYGGKSYEAVSDRVKI